MDWSRSHHPTAAGPRAHAGIEMACTRAGRDLPAQPTCHCCRSDLKFRTTLAESPHHSRNVVARHLILLRVGPCTRRCLSAWQLAWHQKVPWICRQQQAMYKYPATRQACDWALGWVRYRCPCSKVQKGNSEAAYAMFMGVLGMGSLSCQTNVCLPSQQ